MVKITSIKAREILSSGSSPTIEVEVILNDGSRGISSAPFGVSAGEHEAAVLLDNDPARYHGKGALKAIANVTNTIAPNLVGMDATNQQGIDNKMIELDGTPNKAKLGGNAVIATSVACARAAASASKMPLYKYIRQAFQLKIADYQLPNPMMVVIEGGQHADNSTDFQEYLICPKKSESVKENVRIGVEIYQTLKEILKAKNYNTNVGNEGAYAPPGIMKNDEPLELLVQAIEKTGYRPGAEVGIALDPAVSEIYQNGKYHLAKEERVLTAEEMIAYWEKLANRYSSLISLEDGLDQNDWEHWPKLMERLGERMMIMGDDLTVTNPQRLEQAITAKAINAILIKRNQVGTLTETIKTISLARAQNFKHVISHRGGGETSDVALVDIGVATNAAYLKVGPSRGERLEKYNYLMKVEEDLSINN